MNQPQYIYTFNEKVDMPVTGGIFPVLRVITWVIVGLLIFFSLLFKTNIISDLSLMAKVILVTLIIGSFSWKPKTEPVPSPVEVRFYDDSFIVYKGKRYYNHRVTHREYYKLYYSDVEEMNYDERTQRFNIYGDVDLTLYKYGKDGTLPEMPSHHKFVKGGICYFYIIDNDEKAIIDVMENYVGKSVRISE